MPSFSRATAAMRCIVAAWAISMSDGMHNLRWANFGKFSPRAAARGLDSGQAPPTASESNRENTMLRLTRAALAAAALIAAPALAQTPGVSTGNILIGQSAPLTGANAELGNDIRNGALAYFAKVNAAGGVHGRKIELVSLD